MNITLIGMAGSGKSVVGRKLAKHLDYNFIEVDEIIESENKASLQEIINTLGEKRFLETEEKAILELGDMDNTIISPGGSICYCGEALDFLKKKSLIIFIDVSFEVIVQRLKNAPERGIIGLREKGLRTLYDERRQLYWKYADITVDISDTDTIENAVEKVMLQIPEE